MTSLALGLAVTLALVQCAFVDLTAPYLHLPTLAQRILVILDVSVTARILSEPTLGRTSAVIAMLVMCSLCLFIPAGWGIAGLLLLPLAINLMRKVSIKEKCDV
jgi:hypothetical protein